MSTIFPLPEEQSDRASVEYIEITQRLQAEQALREATATICSTLDLPLVLRHIAEQMGRLADATSAYLYSYDREALTATVLAEYIGPGACAVECNPDLGTVYTVTALDTDNTGLFRFGQPNVRHIYVDEPQISADLRDHLRAYGAQTVLEIPLLVGGDVIAYASLWESRYRRIFKPQEVELCQALAQQAAITIHHARLYAQVQQELDRRVRAEAELYELNRRYQLITENTTDLICLVDTSACFVYVSPSFQRVLGYCPEQLIGTNCYALIHPDDIPMVREQFHPIATHGGYEQATFRFRHQDETWHWFEALGTAAKQGGITYTVVVGRDITSRKALEARLLRTQKMESLGYLAGGVAHDFNNLLLVIMGHIELTQLDLDDNPAAQSSLDQALQASRRAAELTRQLLAYAGRGQLMLGPCDLQQVVREVLALLHPRIPPTIVLREQLGAPLPLVEADVSQMRQVVVNMVMNAVDAIGAGAGSLTITTSARWCERAELERADVDGDTVAGEYIVLEIADTGVGMDAETQTKIFDPFFTTKFAGRGLGLAAVQGIVCAQRGAITVQSAPAQGTTFTLLLPVLASALGTPALAARPSGTLPSAVPAINESAQAVLVVDDEADIRYLADRMLRACGMRVFVAADGATALDVLRTHADTIGCALLDLTMPEMDGVDLYHALRAVQPNLPIMIMTGASQTALQSRLNGLDVAGVLPKPFTISDLQAVMTRIAAR